MKSSNKYSMFVGRWQPWHKGHRWLVNQRLKEGKNVLICVRRVPADAKNPFSTKEVLELIKKEFTKLIAEGRIKVITIPDIESINYGRGVGYDIIEHFPPEHVKKISATNIRSRMVKKGLL